MMPPEGAGDEADGVGAEREEYAGGGFVAGEEQGTEDEGGGGPVEEEVVPFDGGADQAGEDHLTDGVSWSGPATVPDAFRCEEDMVFSFGVRGASCEGV